MHIFYKIFNKGFAWLSVLLGTICWIVSILMGVNWITKKLLKKQGNWNEIINQQSLQVDTISGATYTSNGIINAVKDAISKALAK